MTIPTSAEGCGYCGLDAADHLGQKWTEGVGWHEWTRPGAETIEARMRARFAAKEA